MPTALENFLQYYWPVDDNWVTIRSTFCKKLSTCWGNMDHYTLIVVALSLDFLMGEPIWLWSRFPHPVRIMGYLIERADQWLNRAKFKRAKGVLALMILLTLVTGFGWLLAALPWGWIAEILLAAILLGHRSLVQHVRAVADGLEADIEAGRQAVSMIVGRDTKNLDQSGVVRGAIESAAENFSDGVVAPVFWFLLFGLPGIMAYKLVNTADSMIGYRNEKYLEFGWAAARLDDVMNYIPARISAGLIVLASGSARALTVVREDANHHRSPNAGWPEAAMAGALGVALSGPRVYAGELTDDTYVNASGRKDLGAGDIRNSVQVLWKSWGLMLALIALVWLGCWLFTA